MSNEPEERWTPVWDGPGYEVSWDGNFRSLDRTSPSGRSIPGQPIATTTTKDDYELVKYWTAEGKRVTRQAHRVVLENFQFKGAPIPPGLQSRHYDDNGRNNKWRPGSEAESLESGLLATLRQACDEEVLRCSLDAARKAAQRHGFPAVQGWDKSTALYDRADLMEYQAGKVRVSR